MRRSVQVQAIVIFSLAVFLVVADDPDASIHKSDEIDLGNSSPQDEFERGVMKRLRAELRPRMTEFFKTDPSSVTDVEMKNLFESAFTPEEQEEIGSIFTEVITEQMHSVMGNMEGVGGQLDDMAQHTPNFEDWGATEDDHHHLYDEEFNTMDDETDDSGAWNNQKKFVLESVRNREDEEEESSNDEVRENEITNFPPGKAEELRE